MNVLNASSFEQKLVSAQRPDHVLSTALVPQIVLFLDFSAIACAGLGAAITAKMFGYSVGPDAAVPAVVFVAIIFVLLLNARRLGRLSVIMRPVKHLDALIVSLLSAFVIYMAVGFGVMSVALPPMEWLALFTGAAILAACIARLAVWGSLSYLSRRQLIGRSIIVLGIGEQSRQFLLRIKATQPYFTDVVGVACDSTSGTLQQFEGYPVVGDLDDLIDLARRRRIDDVVVTVPWAEETRIAGLIARLRELPVNVYLSSDLFGFELSFRPAPAEMGELPLFAVMEKPISGWGQVVKAVSDRLLAGVGLLGLLPLLALIALAIRLESAGPILFKQRRIGYNNKEFYIYKFRSMYHVGETSRVLRQASRGDPRVTRVGRLIRATSLDELPQLINVLEGTMSLVGPRPHAIEHHFEYGSQIGDYFSRHKVKPGITGWAQVNGYRGETRNIEQMQSRIQHDIYYADNWSLAFDIQIMILTATRVFFQKEAY